MDLALADELNRKKPGIKTKPNTAKATTTNLK